MKNKNEFNKVVEELNILADKYELVEKKDTATMTVSLFKNCDAVDLLNLNDYEGLYRRLKFFGLDKKDKITMIRWETLDLYEYYDSTSKSIDDDDYEEEHGTYYAMHPDEYGRESEHMSIVITPNAVLLFEPEGEFGFYLSNSGTTGFIYYNTPNNKKEQDKKYSKIYSNYFDFLREVVAMLKAGKFDKIKDKSYCSIDYVSK